MINYETRRWLQVVLRVHGSVLPRMLGRTILFAAIGAVVAFAHFERGIDLAIPGTAHTMVGVALGLLLVFRTNASYDRYWEGRTLLGEMVNNCRDLSRQASSYLKDSPEAVSDIHRYISALYAVIRQELRDERKLAELSTVLTGDEIARLQDAHKPPLVVAGWISDTLVAESKKGKVSEVLLRHLDCTISDLVDEWGNTERILTTPVPFAYAHHIKAFLTLFCATAPFTLLASMGWGTPIATAIVAYGLFGIDEIAVEIEDPFGYDANDLPLDAIGDDINRCLAYDAPDDTAAS